MQVLYFFIDKTVNFINMLFVCFMPFRAGIAQLVEHDLAKVGVAGSSPVSRSIFLYKPSNGGIAKWLRHRSAKP